MHLHDKAFRQLMKEPGAVLALVSKCLPAKLTRLIAGEPRPISETYLEHPLRSAIADSVWEIPLRGQRALTVFLILEHKSRADGKIAVQLARYLVGVASWAAKGGDIPLTLALVVYTGKARWSGPRRYAAVVAAPKALSRLGLDFPLFVLDVGRLKLSDFPPHATLKGGLLALKTGSDARDVRASVFTLLASLADDPVSRAFFVEYLHAALPAGENREALVDAVEAYRQTKEPEMKSIRDEINEEIAAAASTAASRATRRATAATLREKLKRVLDVRFKKLPADLDARLARAKADELDRWFDAALTARSVTAVFNA